MSHASNVSRKLVNGITHGVIKLDMASRNWMALAEASKTYNDRACAYEVCAPGASPATRASSTTRTSSMMRLTVEERSKVLDQGYDDGTRELADVAMDRTEKHRGWVDASHQASNCILRRAT